MDVLLVHGISIGDASKKPRDMAKALTRELKGDVKLNFHYGIWWDLLEKLQLDLYRKIMNETRHPILRKLFVEMIGDAICYQPNSEIYEAIHARLLDVCPRPDVIIGHSLGSVIASNHIWDNDLNPKLFVTMGSPLAIWASRYFDYGEPVGVQRWLNYYHPSDVISSPLSILSEKYSYIEDKKLCNLKLPHKAHSTYWGHRFVIKSIVEAIRTTFD